MVARSKAQRAHARAAMIKINSGNKENVGSSSGHFSDGNTSDSRNKPSEPPSALQTERVRVLEYKRLLHNARCKLTRAENAKGNLRAQTKEAQSDAEASRAKLGHVERVLATLQRAKNTLWMCDSRASQKLEAAVERSQTHVLKAKGVFKEEVREMTRDLMSICRVPLAWVNSVIHVVARGLGIIVEDSIDKLSALHITLEGQVAADMQLVNEIHTAGGLTISGDGTTDKHLNYESKHGLLITPTYSSDPNAPIMNTVPTQRFFGINAAIDHKSETQLQGWKDLVD
ncbi:hypothetical protein PILCRDRAFT_11892 [Piloderma croceum F 1598]|uniref:Uncharacterized protein n=1 Tax=Piloderma croceum (strain F 1598) TaxID=765440 RepID=A0A0C3AUP4_PILCF|nr:hypothetical protein PILCRDRAFT_11892 [Piloderma croceum F 1598]